MTRNEALAKLPNERWYGPEAQKGYLLDCLVSLGLIKFNEEVVDSPSSIIADHIRGNIPQPLIKADKIICALMGAGYMIIRKENLK